jgi:hypothetical protein
VEQAHGKRRGACGLGRGEGEVGSLQYLGVDSLIVIVGVEVGGEKKGKKKKKKKKKKKRWR